jgi:hypothetical protein
VAVTQQLARPSPAQLAACRSSVEELDKLCSFELLPSSDYLDLDWAPTPLIRAVELAQVSTPIVVALRRGLDGDAEINPAYRDREDTVWEHPVTGLEPDIVADVAMLFGQVEPEAVLATLPEDATAALAKPGNARVRWAPTAIPASSSRRTARLLRRCCAAAACGRPLVGLSRTESAAVRPMHAHAAMWAVGEQVVVTSGGMGGPSSELR